MRLNEDQRDGLAKVCDNLATAFILTAVLGSWIESKIGVWQAITVLLVATASVIFSLYFRAEGKND
jgi:hypothetical protein